MTAQRTRVARTRRDRVTRWVSPLAVVVAMGGALVATGSASEAADKAYLASATPVLAGDADAAVSLTITNKTSPQTLGSVNAELPRSLSLLDTTPVLTGAVSPGASAAIAGSVIQLRNLSLPPDASVTVTVHASVTSCSPVTSAADTAWSLQVKQANDFNGDPGNDLTGTAPTTATSGQCSLVFTAQPANAAKSKTITSVPYNPSGAKIQATVLDATGAATASGYTGVVSLTLAASSNTGAISASDATAAAGVATFTDPTINAAGEGYRLVATTTLENGTSTAATSSAFDIVDAAVDCSTTACTTGDIQRNISKVNIDAGTVADALLIATLGSNQTFTCPGYDRPRSTEIAKFNTITSLTTGYKKVELTLFSAYQRPINEYQFCFQAPYTFTSPALSAPDANGFYTGVLADCPNGKTVPLSAMPCLKGRSKTKTSVTLTVYAPLADPAGWF